MQSQTLKSLVFELSYHRDTRVQTFRSLSLEVQIQVLYELSRHVQFELMTELTDIEVADVIKQFDADDATDILQILPKLRRQAILGLLPKELAATIAILLQYEPDTAAGMMSVDYITVDENAAMSTLTTTISSYEKRTGKLPTILVLREGKLCGYLPGSKLLFARTGKKVKYFTKRVPTILSTEDYEGVIAHFHEHPLSKSVVVDQNKSILGVIYADDVLDFMQEQQDSSLYDFAGVDDEETVFDSIKKKVLSRYKWLIFNLGTAFLASSVVRLFDDTISTFVVLAAYMPIVAGMGGNAATQTFAVTVRGITLEQITLKSCLPTLKREMIAAGINGLIIGVLVAGIVYLINRDIRISLILATAMITNLLVASAFGTVVPLIMKKLGKDPATSATIFITTATDVLGFTAFLGLAKLVLR
jgi:magnesium transporter